jgi:hypothetical protein
MKTIYNPNLLVNGNFEDGVYTSQVSMGTIVLSNPDVPIGWNSSLGFELIPASWNGVLSANGNIWLAIGGDSGLARSVISQDFGDAPGATYTVSFNLGNVPTGRGDSLEVFIDGNLDMTITATSSNEFTTTLANGKSFVTMENTSNPPGTLPYSEKFSFVGTGDDTLELRAVTPASYSVDNVSVKLQHPTQAVNLPPITNPVIPAGDKLIVASNVINQSFQTSGSYKAFESIGGGHIDDSIQNWNPTDIIAFKPSLSDILNEGININLYPMTNGTNTLVDFDGNSIMVAAAPGSLTASNFLLPPGYHANLVTHNAPFGT